MSFNPLQSFKASDGKKACQRRPNLATCNTKRSNMLKYDIFSVSKPRDVRLGKYTVAVSRNDARQIDARQKWRVAIEATPGVFTEP